MMTKIDNIIPSLLQFVPLRGPVAKVDKSHWFLSLFQNNTCEYFLNPLLLLFYSLHYSSPVPPWSNQSILAYSFFLYFFHCLFFCSSSSTSFTMIRPRMHSCHHQPWFYLLVNSGGLSASASDLVSAFGPCPLWTRWHHTLDGAHFD